MTNEVDYQYSHGHRQRLRMRFIEDLGQSMPDYELLELILCLAIPRRDVKPLAKRLIKQFGNLNGVLAADITELRKVGNGLGEGAIAALKLVHACNIRTLKRQIQRKTIIKSWKELLDYCTVTMGKEKIEQVRLFFLDHHNFLIRDEVASTGTVNYTPLFPREIARRALELGAVSIILVHNHPSGNTKPSQTDIDMTIELRDTLRRLEISLHDHVIISSASYYSFKSHGLI
ncbi:MAG: DNA repair protein RadC [Pseudomonadota bacterium]